MYIMRLRAVNERKGDKKKMKRKINMLVIDDNEKSVANIEEYFSNHAVINVSKVVNNGREALNIILNHYEDYDLILMDLLLPDIDGIAILEKMYSEGIKRNIIVLTSYKREYTVKLTSEYGVNYYMLKPFSLESLEKRILEVSESESIATQFEEPKMQIVISKLLHNLGIPSHIKGYQYIRDSIYLIYENPELIGGITKEIYPEIAMKYDTTASRVERAIRHAIEVSWNRGDYRLMEDIFGHSVDYDRAKPTNSEFIVTIADKIRLDRNLVTI